MKPSGVFIVRGDTGDRVPCELVHQGPNDDGVDQWLIADATFRIGVDRVEIAVMPARTGISVRGVW